MKIIAFQTENHSDNFIKCTFLEGGGGGEKKKKICIKFLFLTCQSYFHY